MRRTNGTMSGLVFAAVGIGIGVGALGASDARAAELAPLVVEATVHAPIGEVWDAFWDEEGRKWMTPACSIDLRVGGLVKCSYMPGGDVDGESAIHHEIVAMEPGRMTVAKLVRGPDSFPHTEAMLGSLGILELDPIDPETTRVRSVVVGLEDDEAGRAAHAYFKEGNAYTLDGLKAHLERADQSERTERALELLHGLAGGEWIHESEIPGGNGMFRVRNVIQMGPDGRSMLSNGWLGFGDEGMFDHGPTLFWVDEAGVIRFSGVHETGAYGKGTVRLIGDTRESDLHESNLVEWDWSETSPDGSVSRFAIEMRFTGAETYETTIYRRGEDGGRELFAGPLEYRRVGVAPERFRTLRSGEVISAGGDQEHTTMSERAGADMGRRIEVMATIDAPVEDVWRSWTTSAGMTAFIGAQADIELRRGGKYEIYFDPTAPEGSRGSERCEVLAYIPNRMLAFTWNAPPQFPNCRFLHTWVVVELTPAGDDSTEVTLTHHGWEENIASHPEHEEEWEGVYAYFERAWPYVMNALKEHYAGERGAGD